MPPGRRLDRICDSMADAEAARTPTASAGIAARSEHEACGAAHRHRASAAARPPRRRPSARRPPWSRSGGAARRAGARRAWSEQSHAWSISELRPGCDRRRAAGTVCDPVVVTPPEVVVHTNDRRPRLRHRPHRGGSPGWTTRARAPGRPAVEQLHRRHRRRPLRPGRRIGDGGPQLLGAASTSRSTLIIGPPRVPRGTHRTIWYMREELLTCRDRARGRARSRRPEPAHDRRRDRDQPPDADLPLRQAGRACSRPWSGPWRPGSARCSPSWTGAARRPVRGRHALLVARHRAGDATARCSSSCPPGDAGAAARGDACARRWSSRGSAR